MVTKSSGGAGRHKVGRRKRLPHPFDSKVGQALSPVNLPAYSDRKSTRLNSSHLGISYAVFCLKKQVDDASRRAQYRKSCQRPLAHPLCALYVHGTDFFFNNAETPGIYPLSLPDALPL